MIDWWVALVPAAFVALFAAAEHHRAERWRDLAVRNGERIEGRDQMVDMYIKALAGVSERAERLRTELLAAQGALEDFGGHEDGCEWRPHMDAELDCTCGLVDAKERARKAVAL